MTILSAVDLGDRIFVAGDSLAFSSGSGTYDDRAVKIWRIGDLPIVWGFYGDAYPGQRVKLLIEERIAQLPTNSWSEFIEYFAAEIASLREHLKLRKDRAGETFDDDHDVARFLFAGYLGGLGRAIAIDDHGREWGLGDVPLVLGNIVGRAALKSALTAIEGERRDDYVLDGDTLLAAMRATCAHVLGAGGEIQVWEVTPVGAEKIR